MENGALRFFGGCLIGLVVMALLDRTVIPFNPEEMSLSIAGPGGKGGFELAVQGRTIDYARVLEQLFSDSFLSAAAAGWLAQHERAYSIDSEDLATAIATRICDPIPESPLEAWLEKARECAEKPVAARLRELSSAHQAPFHYVGKKGNMGVPEKTEHQPAAGRANVCRAGPFFGKKLQIGNLLNNTVIEVEATGSYACTPAATFPTVQLSPLDATLLFPKVSLNRLEPVIIVPLE